jgi:hypothetical protein
MINRPLENESQPGTSSATVSGEIVSIETPNCEEIA